VRPPEGYSTVDPGTARGFALTGAEGWLSGVLAAGGTIHAWAAAHPDARGMTGRGEVYAVPAPVAGPDGRDRWAVRHYRRGGLMAPLLGDRYLAVGTTRPERETRATVLVRARGIPTPAVVAGVVYPDGVFYRGDLVTELIPGAADLAEVLFAPYDGDTPRVDALRAAGALVRKLELAGVQHPDLNAKNLVLTVGPHGVDAHLLDLDRCQVRPPGVAAAGFPMRSRLVRSLRKFARRTGRKLSPAEWEALTRGWNEAA